MAELYLEDFHVGQRFTSATHALDFKMRATLHTSGAVMAVLGAKGDTSVPFTVKGTSSNPSFEPDVKGIAAEKLKSLESSETGKAATSLIKGLSGGGKKN